MASCNAGYVKKVINQVRDMLDLAANNFTGLP